MHQRTFLTLAWAGWLLALAGGLGGLQAQAPAEDPAYEGKSVQDWVKQLKDTQPKARAEAARALCMLGARAKDGVPALTEALKDKSADVRDWAAVTLSKIG